MPIWLHNTAIRIRICWRGYADGMRGNLSSAILLTFAMLFLAGLGVGSWLL